MPNHVTTRCTVTGPATDVAAFRAKMFVPQPENDRVIFDFRSIIPMPAILADIEESNVSENGAELIMLRAKSGAPFATGGMYEFEVERIRKDVGMLRDPIQDVARAYLAKHPEYEAAGLKRLQAITETGFCSWYPWSIEKWGTKWNAYDFSIETEEPLQFKFDTAWSFPTPVFTELAKAFPAIKLHCFTYDEGGNFAGRGFFNPSPSDEPFSTCDATDELYEIVYGHKPERDEDDAA